MMRQIRSGYASAGEVVSLDRRLLLAVDSWDLRHFKRANSSPLLKKDQFAMARQFIYHMQGLTKSYAGGKKVLENIHLSFYPDAKIGILGPNGSGKSTLLRIMGGIDTEWNGEAWLADGATVGYLQQEPELDPQLDVIGNVMEGVAAKKAILDQYNALMADYNDENAEKAGKLQDVIDPQNLWDLWIREVEQAMEALRCPPGGHDRKSVGR